MTPSKLKIRVEVEVAHIIWIIYPLHKNQPVHAPSMRAPPIRGLGIYPNSFTIIQYKPIESPLNSGFTALKIAIGTVVSDINSKKIVKNTKINMMSKSSSH